VTTSEHYQNDKAFEELLAKRAHLMAVNNLDSLADHDVPEHGKGQVECGYRRLRVDYNVGNIVHLQPAGEVADADSIAVSVSQNDNLEAAPKKKKKTKGDKKGEPVSRRIMFSLSSH
jgi:hypothetical protein